MAELLVSVRSAAEAAAALAGGAAIIDVKEPANGPLGRAADFDIQQVVDRVAGARPVSAAFGELAAGPAPFPGVGLSYAKWGLAGCTGEDCWRARAIAISQQWQQVMPQCQPVAVAYADWQLALSPAVEAVFEFITNQNWPVLLLDTWCKNGATLLDWLKGSIVKDLCKRCRLAGKRIALAGSLGLDEIALLRAADPDWFAVRSAACEAGRRDRSVSEERVHQLVALLESPISADKRTRSQ